MMVRIREIPVVCGGSRTADDYRSILTKLSGRTLEVDTEYLFEHSFNVIVDDVDAADDGEDYRWLVHVDESNVAEVIDDARPTCWETYRRLKQL